MSRGKPAPLKILDAATTTETGESHHVWGNDRTYQAIGKTSAGSGACEVAIQVTNDPSNANSWMTLGLITLTLGTTDTADGFGSHVGWAHVRAKVNSISGTGAQVTVWLSTVEN